MAKLVGQSVDVQIGVRLSRAELKKLDQLCRETQRDRAKVLRLLLNQAELQPQPDIRLCADRSQAVTNG